MATWLEVKDYIKSQYFVDGETDNDLTLVFETEDGRTQLVLLTGLEDDTPLSCVRFFSAFARKDQITPAQFTQLAQDAIFGLAQLADWYGVVHNAFLADLDPSEVDAPLAALALNADQIERGLGLGDFA